MFYLALLASQASITSIISPISQSRFVTPAAIAGVVRSVLWKYIANSTTECAWFSTFFEKALVTE
jgi:hypothetical protein